MREMSSIIERSFSLVLVLLLDLDTLHITSDEIIIQLKIQSKREKGQFLKSGHKTRR
jgi:hypothetical protein